MAPSANFLAVSACSSASALSSNDEEEDEDEAADIRANSKASPRNSMSELKQKGREHEMNFPKKH